MQTLGPRLRAHLVLSVPPGLIVGHTPPGGGTLRRPEYSHPKAGAGGRRGPHQGDARGGAQGPVVFGIIVLGGFKSILHMAYANDCHIHALCVSWEEGRV